MYSIQKGGNFFRRFRTIQLHHEGYIFVALIKIFFFGFLDLMRNLIYLTA